MGENTGGPAGPPVIPPVDNSTDNMDIGNVGDNVIPDNNRPVREFNFNNKYKNTDKGPYFVYVEHVDKKIGRLFPIKVGHCLFNNDRFRHDVIDIKSVGVNRVKVIFKTFTIANALIGHKAMKDNGLVAYIPEYYTHRKGVIRMVDTQFSEEYLKDAIKSTHEVVSVKRMTRKVINQDKTVEYRPRQVIIVTFLGSSLPQTVRINLVNFEVSNYIYPVVQCFNCYRYGHTSRLCRSNTRCKSCPNSHDGNDSDDVCSGVDPYCIHCHTREHSSTSKDCPEYKKQFGIKKIMATDNITFKEAAALVGNPSYSKVVNNNRFSILKNDENFPPLPTPKPDPLVLLRKPVRQLPPRALVGKRKAVSPATTSREQKRRPEFTSPESGAQSVLPNPYRDDFMQYRERLISQISAYVNNIVKSFHLDPVSQNTVDLAPKIREYVFTIFNSRNEEYLSSDNESTY